MYVCVWRAYNVTNRLLAHIFAPESNLGNRYTYKSTNTYKRRFGRDNLRPDRTPIVHAPLIIWQSHDGIVRQSLFNYAAAVATNGRAIRAFSSALLFDTSIFRRHNIIVNNIYHFDDRSYCHQENEFFSSSTTYRIFSRVYTITRFVTLQYINVCVYTIRVHRKNVQQLQNRCYGASIDPSDVYVP